jgi:hypothetical protein
MILFRRGDSFVNSGSNNINPAGPGTIGSFGTGAKPVVNDINSDESTISVTEDDWRIVDLDIRGTGVGNSGNNGIAMPFDFFDDNPQTELLVLRLNIKGVNDGVVIGGRSEWAHDDQPGRNRDLAFVVDSVIGPSAASGSGTGRALSVCTQDSAILGNYMFDTFGHINRIQCARRLVIAHNEYENAGPQGTSGTRLLQLKLHAPSPSRGGGFSEEIILSDNLFDGRGYASGMLVSIGPQDAYHDEHVQDVVVEHNHWAFSNLDGALNKIALHYYARQVTIRNNIIDFSESVDIQQGINAAGSTSVSTFNLTGIQVYGNTCYSDKNTVWTATCVIFSSAVIDGISKNNLLYSPNQPSTVVSGCDAGDTCTANFDDDDYTGNPFISSNPLNPEEFMLDDESPAASVLINQGVNVPVLTDFFGTSRPQGSGFDTGAFEYQGGEPPPACISPADQEPCDDCIDGEEITAFIDRWYADSTDVFMVELIRALELWKAGC